MSTELMTIDVDKIIYDETFNCRGRIQPASCRELAISIQQQGLGQPIVVAPNDDGTYNLISGHRRFVAITKILRRKKILSVINSEYSDPVKARLFNLTENIQRQDLSLIQEIRSLKAMLQHGIDHDEIAKVCGRSKGWVKNRLKISELPTIVQQDLNEGNLKLSQVDALYDYASLGLDEKVLSLAHEMKKANLNHKNFDRKKYLTRTNTKKCRSDKEIHAMLDHFLDYFEPNMASRMLSWACGTMDDKDLHSFISRYAQENDWELLDGVTEYQRPF